MNNDYDAFEAEMLEAGWTLDEIEAVWQQVLEDMSNLSHCGTDYRHADPFYIPDMWDRD